MTIRLEAYLVRSFFSHYNVEIPLQKIRFCGKLGRLVLTGSRA